MKTVRNHINICTGNIIQLCEGIANMVDVIKLGNEDLAQRALNQIVESNSIIAGDASWIEDCIKELSLDDEL